MRLETILDAYTLAAYYRDSIDERFVDYQRICRQEAAFRARILRMDAEKEQMIRDMAWLTYCDQVIDTGMKEHLIGPDNEYADMEDWIESYIDGLKAEANND